jgi:hypothetical protein
MVRYGNMEAVRWTLTGMKPIADKPLPKRYTRKLKLDKKVLECRSCKQRFSKLDIMLGAYNLEALSCHACQTNF